MEVVNQQTALETVWSTLTCGQRDQALRTLVMVCYQMARVRQPSHQKLTRPDPIPDRQEVGHE